MKRPFLVATLLCTTAVAGCGGGSPSGASGATNLRPSALLVVAGDTQVGTAGTELPTALIVKVVDANNQPVASQIVNFRVTQGGGSVFAGASLTNADGIAKERWTLGPIG